MVSSLNVDDDIGQRRISALLDTEKQIEKYELDSSTFDLVDVDQFHRVGFGVVMDYLIFVWLFFFLHWTLLGVDIYTCLNILVFHRWSEGDYQVYAYLVAKWIFTGCIIFELLLRMYQWTWAFRTFRTKNIALCYVNFWTKLMYSMKRYNYHCLFYSIKQDTFFDLCAMYSFSELDNILSLCVADAPRQVINILTLRYYATLGDYKLTFLQIGSNIAQIATTNVKLAVVLLFMCASLVIFAIFFFKFLGGMLCYIPVVIGIRRRGYKSLKKYCCDLVNMKVRILVRKHHKSKQELLDLNVLNIDEIKLHPLLNLTTTFTDSNFGDNFDYRGVSTAANGGKFGGNGFTSSGHLPMMPLKLRTYELLPMSDLTLKAYNNSDNPFRDQNQYGALESVSGAKLPLAPEAMHDQKGYGTNFLPASLERRTSDSSLTYEQPLNVFGSGARKVSDNFVDVKTISEYGGPSNSKGNFGDSRGSTPDVTSFSGYPQTNNQDPFADSYHGNPSTYGLLQNQSEFDFVKHDQIDPQEYGLDQYNKDFGKDRGEYYDVNKEYRSNNANNRVFSGTNRGTSEYNSEEAGRRESTEYSEYRPYTPQFSKQELDSVNSKHQGKYSQDTGLLGEYYGLDPTSAPPYPLRESTIVRKYSANEIYPEEDSDESREENNFNRGYPKDYS